MHIYSLVISTENLGATMLPISMNTPGARKEQDEHGTSHSV